MNLSSKDLLQVSGVAGFLSFIAYTAMFLLAPADPVSSPAPFVPAINFASIIAFCVYMYGFVLIGIRFKKPYITKAAYGIIGLNIILSFASYMYGGTVGGMAELFMGTLGVLMSAAVIVLGWSFLDLKNQLGWLAAWYGCLELLTGTGVAFFFSVELGIAIDLALYVLGITILFLVASGRHEKHSVVAISQKPYFLTALAIFAGALYLLIIGVMSPNGCLPFNPDDPACQGTQAPSLVEPANA